MRDKAASSREREAEERDPFPEAENLEDPVSRWWQWWPGLCLALALLYLVLPYSWLTSIFYVLATLTAAIGIAIAAYYRQRLYRPAAWIMIACALWLTAIGNGIWYWLDLRGLDPFPSIADAFYLGSYPLFMVAIWKLGPRSGRNHDALIDALIVATSSAVLGWALLIAPYVNDTSLGLAQLLVTAAYPVADLILFPLVLHLVFLRRTRILAHLMLLLGMLAYLAADLLYAHGNLVGWYAPGGVTDGLWLLAYTLFVAAAWHPSARVEPQAHASNAELSHRRLFLLGAASILVPSVILFTAGRNIEIVKIAALASILLFLLVMHRLAGLLRETHQQAEALEKLSRIDPLTGAANRRQLNDALAIEMARAERTGAPLSLAFLDLDHFKAFNDTHGHSAGDVLLQSMVTAWQKEMRPADVLARFGGEEFVVVLPDTDIDQAQRALERLRESVPSGQTCSAGLTVFQSADTADAIIHRADQALYTAKGAGRNRVVCADRAALGDGSA